MQIFYTIFLLILLAASVFNVGRVFAESNGNSEVVEEVEVFADYLRYEIEVDKTQAANILGIEAIQQMQTADVFETLGFIPGLTIEGGVTTKGKSFSIRGFGSNEDVLVQIDGVTQNFQKYRSGSGIEIEPDLLKEIAVFRGGTSVAQGAGYLGGVVQMETKDARDFLGDEKYGATIRAGYKDNNYENFNSITAYALPVDGIDLLINAVKRKSDDIRKPNGEIFSNTDENQESLLAKIEGYTLDSIISYSFRSSLDEGLEPYDLVSSGNNLFQNQYRRTEEKAHSLRGQYKGDVDELDFVLGYIDKSFTEQNTQSNISDFDPSKPIKYFQYDVWNLSLKSISDFTERGMPLRLTFGIQATREERRSLIKEEGVINEYKPQPSGTKDTKAVFMDGVFDFDPWRLQLGLRRDHYAVYSLDDEVLERTKLRFGDEKIRFTQTTPSYSIDRNVGDFTFYYRQSKAFRAPLVTQYFSPSQMFATSTSGENTLTGLGVCGAFDEVLVPVDISDYPGDLIGYAAALSEFTAIASTSPERLQANYFCGDVFRPSESMTSEGGVIWDLGGRLRAKITYFDVHTKYTLNSLYQDASGEVSQPGNEYRYGSEVELDWDLDIFHLAINWSELSGSVETIVQGEKREFELSAPPGDRLNISLIKMFDALDASIGINYRNISSRLVNQNQALITRPEDYDPKVVDGYEVYDIFSRWEVNEQLSLRLSVQNVKNEEYELRGFGGDTSVGNVAPGRDVRLLVSYQL